MSDNKKTSIGGKSTCHLLNIKQPERAAKRLKLSFRRAGATLNLLNVDKPIPASLGLLDLTENGGGFFTASLLPKGSKVEICVTEPKLLRVKGIVAWSVPVSSGVEAQRFPFRSGIQFLFENEVQRTAVLEFIQKVYVDPITDFKRPQAPVPANGLEAAAATNPEAPKPVEGAPAAAAADPAAPAAAAPTAPADATAPAAVVPVEATPAAAKAEEPASSEGDGQAKAA